VRPIEAMADPGSYLALRRTWQNGDTISLRLPMGLRQEPLPGDDSAIAALYGPLVLAADLGAGPPDSPQRVVHGRPTEPKDIPAPIPLPKLPAARGASVKQWVGIESPAELRFAGAGESAKYQLLPMYQVGDQRYSIYWKTKDPKEQG
jgi:uncharacterized protein